LAIVVVMVFLLTGKQRVLVREVTVCVQSTNKQSHTVFESQRLVSTFGLFIQNATTVMVDPSPQRVSTLCHAVKTIFCRTALLYQWSAQFFEEGCETFQIVTIFRYSAERFQQHYPIFW